MLLKIRKCSEKVNFCQNMKGFGSQLSMIGLNQSR